MANLQERSSLRERPSLIRERAKLRQSSGERAMRLSQEHIRELKRLAAEEAGVSARLRLFGSRLDDAARGGDVDLLLELDTPVTQPAPLIARLAARASRAMDGRKVDVLLLAPNLLRQPIHDVAQKQGILL